MSASTPYKPHDTPTYPHFKPTYEVPLTLQIRALVADLGLSAFRALRV